MSLADPINRAARVVPTWMVYVIGLLPVPWLLYMAQTGGLGREPIEALEHELGLIALQLLVAGLAITPLRRFASVNLLRFRRAVGLLAFCYVALHLLVWLVLDIGLVGQIWEDIVKRPYITIGMAAFLLMIPLAVTSNGASVRKLGAGWRKLHRLTYLVALLGALHYTMLVKTVELEPLAYLAGIVGLLALRLPVLRKRRMA